MDCIEHLTKETRVELEFDTVLCYVAALCRTELGKESALAKQPLFDPDKLEFELVTADEARKLLIRNLYLPIECSQDPIQIIQKAAIPGAVLSAADLLFVCDFLRTIRYVGNVIREHQDTAPKLSLLANGLVEFRILEKHINDVVDETGAVRDTASTELTLIRRQITGVTTALRNKVQQLLRDYGDEDLLIDEYVTQRDGRFVLPVRSGSKRAVDGIIHGVSRTGSTVFFEPAEVFTLNNELALLHGRELQEIERLLSTLTSEVGGVATTLTSNAEQLTQIDIAFAVGQYAVNTDGVCPVLAQGEMLSFKNVRHPVLVNRLGAGKVVPISVELGSELRGILISGPNAGGKTVAMKTIGLSLLMAQSGIFPLGDCTFSPYTVFSAIGDQQSITADLSTFSSQVSRIRDILSHCGGQVFVLIDEICSGTDPTEGGALAIAVVESMVSRNALFIVTTHQTSLKLFALARKDIVNGSMEFDAGRMQPNFRFHQGLPGNSHAFAVAESLGLPSTVLERAKAFLGDKHIELEKNLDMVRDYRSRAELDALEAERAKLDMVLKKVEYDRAISQLKVQQRAIIEEGHREVKEYMEKARSLVEGTIMQVRSKPESAGEQRKKFEQEREALEQQYDFPAKAADTTGIQVGSYVKIEGTMAVGRVIEMNGLELLIDINGLRVRTEVSKVYPAEKKEQKALVSSESRPLLLSVPSRIDIRGSRVADVVTELDKRIADAISANLTSVEIIHGKGTGALRKAVQDFLSEHPQVSSFRTGHITEGGDGVTFVALY